MGSIGQYPVRYIHDSSGDVAPLGQHEVRYGYHLISQR